MSRSSIVDSLLRAALFLGAAVDVALGLLILFFPRALSVLLDVPLPREMVYLWLAGLLAVGLGAAYALAGCNPVRYFGNVVLAAAVRLAGAFFFLVVVATGYAPRVFLAFALMDGAFGLVHAFHAARLVRLGGLVRADVSRDKLEAGSPSPATEPPARP
ncbi:MAG: hypothetical protein JSV08_02665 [Acidobacteriota bacterium]|nr:MAG: hypothetical protein JSV08_02665 [Acidobacteriota bacterium]